MPDGLAGTDIPLEARIAAVADAFDAMTSGRPYRQERTLAEAGAELARCAGAQFDPQVVAAFREAVDRDEIRVDAEHTATYELTSRPA
jgi:HD-GYP domain-containing protein (c-di-GMP phosphodiesterase class II)